MKTILPRYSGTVYSSKDQKTLSKTQLEDTMLDKYPMPPHWKATDPAARLGRIRGLLFNGLCMASFGHPGLEPIWASIKLQQAGDDTLRDLSISTTCERLNNMIIVVSRPLSVGIKCPFTLIHAWCRQAYF